MPGYYWPTPCQNWLIRVEVWQAFADANGGRFPVTAWDWRRVARRFGIRRLEWADPEVVEAPSYRYDLWGTTCVLVMPRIRDRKTLTQWFLHEIAEASMWWEGRSAFRYPVEWGEHHDLSQMVEMSVFGKIISR